MLQPNPGNKTLLAMTRAKAKMYEYAVPPAEHFQVGAIPLGDLLDLTIGMLGDLAAGADISRLHEERYRLLFSAQYFDSLVQSEIISEGLVYLKLLAAATYYLSEYPGSASVVLKTLSLDESNSLQILEKVLWTILKREKLQLATDPEYIFSADLIMLEDSWNAFLENGIGLDDLISIDQNLRKKIYSDGSDRDVLAIDIIRSVLLRRVYSSCWAILPKYSELEISKWQPYLKRENSLKELWPAQIRLAEQGVLKGVSAVVQMPTSAGKTRGSELIIRSAFLSERASLAVIVAPYRALCQEIYNDLASRFREDADIDINIVSDVLQNDLVDLTEARNSVLVLTPEKLDFLLRQNETLVGQIGLVIYDEGHLFDDGTRGIKYELLLASLKRLLSAEAQVILISAVISNAQEIKDWLIGQSGILIDGKDLSPTSRNIAFADWSNRSRNLQFVDDHDINQSLFFVPSLLVSQEINKKGRERIARFYPQRDEDRIYNSSQIAGFLGCRLSSVGLSAIFTGRKDSVQKIASEIIDAYDRGLNLAQPIDFSESREEANKVITYVERLFGEDNVYAKAAKLGILTHHGNTPHGLRLTTEHALQNSHFKVIICTSTLAQGVNLPIRYLIVATDRQGREQIKVRDFHNLMGRAGRSGKYTEGTVIFADPRIYGGRLRDRGRWDSTSKLIDNNNSEPSKSRLLSLFDDEPLSEEEKVKWTKDQVNIKEEIGSQLLTSLSDVTEVREMEKRVTEIAQNTLGYFQLDSEEKKTSLVGIFIEIGGNIMQEVPEVSVRKSFAKSILSLEESKSLLQLIAVQKDSLLAAETPVGLLEVLWSALHDYTDNSIVKKFQEIDALRLCKEWINGSSFISLFAIAAEMEINSNRRLDINQIIDLCEGGFSYSMSLLIGSISELLKLVGTEEEMQGIQLKLATLQKNMKYGAPGILPSVIYEMGFSDRQLSVAMAIRLGGIDETFSGNRLARMIREDQQIQQDIYNNYPAYFAARLDWWMRT